MTKKDILIFLNLYLLAIKGSVKDILLNNFRDDIYVLLTHYESYFEFKTNLNLLKLCSNQYYIYKNFYYYLEKIEKILDK